MESGLRVTYGNRHPNLKLSGRVFKRQSLSQHTRTDKINRKIEAVIQTHGEDREMAKTIIFDLGGVLVHLDWDKVCAPLARLSDQSYAAVMKEVRNGPVVEASMLGSLTPQEFHQALCAKIHVDIPYGPFVQIWNGLLSADAEMASLVTELGSARRLVLASNTDAIHFAYAQEHFSVLRAFDRFFLSYEMGLLKPDPAYFQHLLRGLQTAPGDCLFIDDRAENVQAARETGINAFVFGSTDKLKADLEAFL